MKTNREAQQKSTLVNRLGLQAPTATTTHGQQLGPSSERRRGVRRSCGETEKNWRLKAGIFKMCLGYQGYLDEQNMTCRKEKFTNCTRKAPTATKWAKWLQLINNLSRHIRSFCILFLTKTLHWSSSKKNGFTSVSSTDVELKSDVV